MLPALVKKVPIALEFENFLRFDRLVQRPSRLRPGPGHYALPPGDRAVRYVLRRSSQRRARGKARRRNCRALQSCIELYEGVHVRSVSPVRSLTPAAWLMVFIVASAPWRYLRWLFACNC